MATDTHLKSELEPLRFFLGSWRCGGTMFASPQAPEHAFEATFEIEPVLEGAWIAGRYREETSADHPVALIGWEMWGFDREHDRFVSRFFTNAGEGGTLTGSGWKDGRWEWTGHRAIGDAMVPFRAAFTRKDEGYTLRPMLKPGSEWVAVAELAFTR